MPWVYLQCSGRKHMSLLWHKKKLKEALLKLTNEPTTIITDLFIAIFGFYFAHFLQTLYYNSQMEVHKYFSLYFWNCNHSCCRNTHDSPFGIFELNLKHMIAKLTMTYPIKIELFTIASTINTMISINIIYTNHYPCEPS